MQALDELNPNLMLLQLDTSAQIQLCEAAQAEADALYLDESMLRGACLAQAASVSEVIAATYTDTPTDQQLDDGVAACEAELERCVADGVALAECSQLPQPCGARIADYRECIESVLAVPEQLTTISCEDYVREASSREQVRTVVDEALAPCRDQLAFCSDPFAWEQHAAHTVLFDPPDDETSNSEWVDDAAAVMDGHARNCDDALSRDDALDDTAALIAAEPIGSSVTLNVETTTEWKSVTAPRLEIVLARLSSYLDDQSENCAWRRYGLAVHGEVGESRHAVLVLAE
jgi:hypothetical protein